MVEDPELPIRVEFTNTGRDPDQRQDGDDPERDASTPQTRAPRRVSATFVCSHVNSGSVRPKCPYAAVCL